jgi:transposase
MIVATDRGGGLMTDGCLFSLPEPSPRKAEAPPKGAPRIRRADRRQMRPVPTSPESLLEEGHQARAVWAYVEQLDLSALYDSIEAVKGKAGRPATDPKILLALWLYATIDGVGSARALDRLCREHVAYRWICGGVGMNFSTLSEFRRANMSVLDELLTQCVAVLRCQGPVTLKRLAQDGMRVRANAGAASFRRAKSLKQALKYARRRIRKLRRELDEDPAACTKRQRAAKERGGFAKQNDIERVAGAGCTVYAPVPKPRYDDTDRYEPRPKDSEEIAEWRQRMRTDEAKEIYKERAATVECVNASARNRGLRPFPVRGLEAVKSVALLFAIARAYARGRVLRTRH